MQSKKKNLIIILGPTGVGKSITSIRIAKQFDGEIINCDSMQVYKGFDIGTDKLPLNERENIPHYLLSIVDASTQFTAADFAKLALKTIGSIREKGRLPIITGGTGLYLKALLEGLFPEGEKNPIIRRRLENEAKENGLEFLRKELTEIDPDYARKIGKNDRIRIIRALEVFYSTGKPVSAHFLNTKSYVKDFNIIKIGLKLKREILYFLIDKRVEKMFEKGIIKEVQNLLQEGVEEKSPPFKALGYKNALKFIHKDICLEDAISLTKIETHHYAKRQMIWFRKMEGIKWFSPDNIHSILNYVERNLN